MAPFFRPENPVLAYNSGHALYGARIVNRVSFPLMGMVWQVAMRKRNSDVSDPVGIRDG